ncbi:MAG: hypothetical protein ACI4EG_06850 [Fusicatenibacter sp.]
MRMYENRCGLCSAELYVQ